MRTSPAVLQFLKTPVSTFADVSIRQVCTRLYWGVVKRGSSPILVTTQISVRERAYQLIQQKILQGKMPPGTAVSEVALAQELGSSRTPVREALGQLIAEGLLDQTANRGTVVVQLRRQDIIDLYELREALEVYVVGKVARLPKAQEDLERLQNFAAEIRAVGQQLKKNATLDDRQMARFIACDLGFHSLLLRMAANARILKTVNETRLLIRIFSIRRQSHNAALLAKIHRYHRDIAEAIARGDDSRASQLMSRHIQQSRQERLAEYDEWEHESSMRDALPALPNL